MARGQAVRVQEAVKKKSRKINLSFDVLVSLWKPKFIVAILLGGLMLNVYQQDYLQKIWPVESVKIEGEFRYLDKEKMRLNAMPMVKGGLLTVKLVDVRNALIKMPWVEDVSVRRQWPNELVIRVIEKKPVVFWGDDGVLSAKGKLFKPEARLSDVLPLLTGPDGQHQMMLQEMARMQAWLLETGLHIKEMTQDARRSWTLKLSDGMELRLGRQLMHERLNRFVSIYKNNLQVEKREIKHVDMRYTNGFAVAWKEA